jgi:MSHA pilin protein MshC
MNCPVHTEIVSGASRKPQRGFTLVELITIMVVVGILGAIAGPKFFDRGVFDSREFHDSVISTLRYAQKTAIASRRYVCVAFGTNSLTLTYDPVPPPIATPQQLTSTCTTVSQLTGPSGQSPYTVTPGTGNQAQFASNTGAVPYTPTNFYFNSLGQPSVGQSFQVSGSTSITVEAVTGYVH